MNKEEIKFMNILNSYSRKQVPPFSMNEYALIQYENFCKELIQENKQLKERIDNRDFLLKSQGKELKELYSIIDKAITYLEQPNRDNFDFSKAILLEILKGDSNEKGIN